MSDENVLTVTLSIPGAREWWRRQKLWGGSDRIKIRRNALAMARRRGIRTVVIEGPLGEIERIHRRKI